MPETRAYEAPQLTRLAIGRMGKHQVFDVLPAEAVTARWDIEGLLEKHGSPLFVISEQALRDLYRSFRDTFTAAGIDTRVAYSYKTNYLPAVCSVLADEGAWSEVVSGMEYSLARALGTPPASIVFNGPYKTRAELETAVLEGALVNIDNFDEIEALDDVARTVGRAARVGIRVNVRYGPNGWTKFGFSYDSGEARQALQRIRQARRLRLVALHNHCGTFNLDPQIYATTTQALIELGRFARKLGLKPTVVDLGGGYPSSNQLKPAFDLPGRRAGASNLAAFAEAILGPLGRAKDVFGGRPTVILEPGRAVVDAAVFLAARVVAVKEIPEQGPAVIIDAGVNVLPTAYWYDHPVEAVDGDLGGGAGKVRPTRVYGPMCMQIDVVRERAPLPPLKVGAPLVIANVGAYCISQSMQFIQPRPAVVLLGPTESEVVRRRETWRDIFALDHVPERLRRAGYAL
jgi:diaminopimelate decarboxylase